MAVNRFTYVDFSKTPQPAMIIKNTHPVATVADTEIDSFTVNGNDFEILWVQAGVSTAYTPSATGWLLPLGATDADGWILNQGSMNVPSTRNKYTTGTDAFYLKVKFIQTVLADTDVITVGFREAGTTQVTDIVCGCRS